ncbi:MAG: hypothetical protein IJI06_03275 [Oscillospiraceae bacterium]|jgi:hypothetical protein|nr:hypothetical protein [Oscillospiraceae bacterium]
MNYWCVVCKDHLNREGVTVGDMLSRSEALRLARTISEFQACEVYIMESAFCAPGQKGGRR